MPIPSKLIIYQKNLDDQNLLYFIKYGIAYRELSLPYNTDYKKRRRFCSVEKYIQRANIPISHDRKKNNLILKSVSRPNCLTTFYISLGQEDAKPVAKLMATSFLKKLMSQCKRIKTLRIKFGKWEDYFYEATKLMARLKLLQRLNCYFSPFKQTHFLQLEKALNYISRGRLTYKLEHQNLEVVFITQENIAEVISMLNALRLASSVRRTDVRLVIALRENIDNTFIEQIGGTIANIHNLVHIVLRASAKDMYNFLKFTTNNTRLAIVHMNINYSYSADLLAYIVSETLCKLPFLKKLQIMALDLVHDVTIEKLAYELGLLTNLQTLSFLMIRKRGLTDDTLFNLAHSLSLLTNLKELQFVDNITPSIPTTTFLDVITSSKSIVIFFKSIKNIPNLESMNLNFSKFHRTIDDQTLEPLYSSLTHLSKLRTLNLVFNKCNIESHSISQLCNVLPMLKDVKYLTLKFLRDSEDVNIIDLSELAVSLKEMKQLSQITLAFSKVKLSDEFVIRLNSSLRQLKYINRIDFQLEFDNSAYTCNDDTIETLQRLIKNLSEYIYKPIRGGL